MALVTTAAKWYRANRGETILGALVVVILLSGYLIGQMVGRAFAGESGFRESFRTFVELLPFVDLVNVVSVIIGLYLGLLLLLFIDFKKRVQSLLLLAGTAVSFVMIWNRGVMFTAMGPLDWTIVFVSLSLTAVLIGGQSLRRLSISLDDIYRNRVFTTENDDPVEFPRAANILWWLLFGFILVSTHEAYTQYPELVVAQEAAIDHNLGAVVPQYELVGSEWSATRDILAGFLFLGSFRVFLQYEASKQVVFIGPPRSGKTHLIIGLFSQAQNENLNPRDVSEHVVNQRGFIINNREWANETTATIHEMGFQYTTPGLFSKNVVVNGLDYPGEYSYFIPEGLELAAQGMVLPNEPIDEKPPVEFGSGRLGKQIQSQDLTPPKQSRWSHLVENYNNGYEDEFVQRLKEISGRRDADGGGSVAQKYAYMVNSVLPRIREADVVAFAFDTEQHLRWMNGDDDAKFGDVGYYQRIMDLSNAKQSIGVATKADLLREEYMDIEHLEPADDYDRFRDFVNDRLLGGPFGGEIQSLQITPYPVFIENSDNQDSPNVPIRAFGVDKLLEKLGR